MECRFEPARFGNSQESCHETSPKGFHGSAQHSVHHADTTRWCPFLAWTSCSKELLCNLFLIQRALSGGLDLWGVGSGNLGRPIFASDSPQTPLEPAFSRKNGAPRFCRSNAPRVQSPTSSPLIDASENFESELSAMGLVQLSCPVQSDRKSLY